MDWKIFKLLYWDYIVQSEMELCFLNLGYLLASTGADSMSRYRADFQEIEVLEMCNHYKKIFNYLFIYEC